MGHDRKFCSIALPEKLTFRADSEIRFSHLLFLQLGGKITSGCDFSLQIRFVRNVPVAANLFHCRNLILSPALARQSQTVSAESLKKIQTSFRRAEEKNMKFINKKYITIGILTLLIGVLAAFAANKTWWNQSSSAQGTVVAFILSPEGKTDGAVLDTGDQIHFGAETGAIISRQIKIGDAMTATGHAGTKSDYGRELRAETVQIGDQTITVVNSKPKPPRGERKPGPREDKDRRKPRPGDDKMPPAPQDADAPKPEDFDATPSALSQSPVAPRQTASASGQVRFVLVGGRGEARGLILSGGEQIALPKEVNDAGLSFSQDTQISVEGEAAKSDAGTFIRPTRLSIGNQTFSFNR